MARNIKYICGTLFLCIVILYFTGVAFPKYIEFHNLKKRAVFNSSMAVFKLVSNENLASDRTGFGNSVNSSNFARVETENSSQSSFQKNIVFDRLITPVKGERLKRDTVSQKNSNEILSWNLNLNVSRTGKTALHEVTKSESVPSDSKKLKVSVYVNSQGTQKTAIGELQRALDSLSSFLKNVFGSGSENRTYELKVEESEQSDLSPYFNFKSNTEKGIEQKTITKNQITQSIEEASLVPELATAQNPNSQNHDKSRNESLVKTGREGRIFIFLEKMFRKTSVSEIETTKNLLDIAQTEANILQGEILPSRVTQEKSEQVTKISNEETIFNSDSLESSVKFLTDHFTNDNAENLPLPQTTQLAECSGCVTGGLESHPITNEESENRMLEATNPTETVFTNEILENFCKSIQNDLSQFRPSPLTDEESEIDTTMAEESSVISIEDSAQFVVQTDKERRFFSLFDSGSGRSDITSDEKNLTSFEHLNELSKFPSISDCLLFLSKQRNTQKSLTLSDINDLENSILQNVENSSVISNLKEELKLSSNLNSSDEAFDEIPDGTEIDLAKSKTSLGDEKNFTARDLSGKHEETDSESKDFNLGSNDITESTDPDGVEKTTDRRDGKFLSFPFFGSGSLSEMLFDRIVGSGARSLEDSDGLEETVDFGSGDSVDIEDFSGDMFLAFDRDPSEDFSVSSGEDPRLRLLGFTGSGDGRELTDNSEDIITELSDINKRSNCSYGVKKQLLKCDDYECKFGNIHEENSDTTKSGANIPFNDSDCRDDCCLNAELLNRDNSSISVSETNPNKNMTVYFHEKSEKCTCFGGNNFNDENEAIPECDCTSDTFKASDAPYINPENNFSTDIGFSKYPTGINEYENCNGCNYEKFSEKSMLVTPSISKTSELTYEIEVNDTSAYKEVKGPSHLDKVNNNDFRSFSLEPLNTEESLHQVSKTTVMKPRHFVGTIFLTGSGDGGLFGDDSRPINLEEEVRTINPLVNSRRRGRLDDPPNLPGPIQEKSLERPQTTQTENNFSSKPIIRLGDEIATSPMSKSKGEATMLKENIADTEITTFRPVMISNAPSSDAPPDLEFRPCIGAINCNATLGERCIKLNSTSVCQCGRNFVRQKLTRKCVAKRHVEASLKLPAEIFHSDLRDPESARYKSTSEKSVDTMWLLLNEMPDIRWIVTDVRVSKFNAGSLIISMYLVLAVDNESQVELLKGLEEKLQKALLNENLMQRASLNIRNATVLSISSELDPCMLEELNSCSRNAYCKKKEGNQGSYTCHCKEHFLDVSSDPLFPGEKCIDKCPPSYCGPNGHCEIIENERHCLCDGLHFGERCEVPGMVILCALTVTAIVSLVVLCAVIIILRCRKTSYGGSPTFHRSEEFGPHAITACRVSDAIALVENPKAKVSKFAQISTPVAPPVIKITQPTLNESSISFECDSSFDVTPTHEQEESMGN